jgi:hypothetical protein
MSYRCGRCIARSALLVYNHRPLNNVALRAMRTSLAVNFAVGGALLARSTRTSACTAVQTVYVAKRFYYVKRPDDTCL